MLQSKLSIFLLIAVMCFSFGCAAQKYIPHMGYTGIGWEARMDRDDYTVLGAVEGESELASYAFGIVRIIDGEKLQLFGIKFFEEKFAFQSMNMMSTVGPSERAYYKALAAAPDADVVLRKSYFGEKRGIPFINRHTKVIWTGKALKLREG